MAGPTVSGSGGHRLILEPQPVAEGWPDRMVAVGEGASLYPVPPPPRSDPGQQSESVSGPQGDQREAEMGSGPHARPRAQGRGPGDQGQAALSGRLQRGRLDLGEGSRPGARGRRGAPHQRPGSLPGHTCQRTPGGPVTVSGRVSGRLYRHVRSPHPHCRQPGRQGPGTPCPPPSKLGSPLRLVGGTRALQRPPP